MNDKLRPAQGMINGIILGTILWMIIGAMIYLCTK
ncbi:putative membrane protein [Propionispora sp. 2/2-37]|nr:putative membrane protein [Propionispora sp. 2/2-37]